MVTRLSPQQYQNNYNDDFFDKIIEYKNVCGFRDEPLRVFIDNNSFLLTMTFDGNRIKKREYRQYGIGFSLGSIELENFRFLYSNVSDHLFGRNYLRKSKPKIFALACLDANGTKNNSYNKAEDKFENIHVHAIIIIPPDYNNNFIDYIKSEKFFKLQDKKLDCDNIQLKPITLQDHKSDTVALKKVISYTTKLMRRNFDKLRNPSLYMGAIEESFYLFPEQLSLSKNLIALRPKLDAMDWTPHNRKLPKYEGAIHSL